MESVIKKNKGVLRLKGAVIYAGPIVSTLVTIALDGSHILVLSSFLATLVLHSSHYLLNFAATIAIATNTSLGFIVLDLRIIYRIS